MASILAAVLESTLFLVDMHVMSMIDIMPRTYSQKKDDFK
jgi:hypothetical protein